MKVLSILCLLACALGAAHAAQLMAGAARVDATMPVGVPLAGYNHGARRVPKWPIPEPKKYTFWMTPSEGSLDPSFARSLVIDDGHERTAFISMDAIGADGGVFLAAWEKARAMGFTVPFEKTTFHASHSHSQPGGVTTEKLWIIAPATDIYNPHLRSLMAEKMAESLVSAERNMVPAKLNIGVGQYHNFTKNRRADISPYVESWSVDPNMGVMRVDTMDNKPLATMWNFAIHGVCFGPDNMKSSTDIMGAVNTLVESQLGGISMFVNADAGDIDPADGMCDEKPNFAGAPKMAKAVLDTRAALTPSTNVTIFQHSHVTEYGDTNLNITLERLGNCKHPGKVMSELCALCQIVGCDANLHLDSNWVENSPRFTGRRFTVDGVHHGMVTLPGEPLLDVGNAVRKQAADQGFDTLMLQGYSNNHMGYCASEREYVIGSYESQLTMWGVHEDKYWEADAAKAMGSVKP